MTVSEDREMNTFSMDLTPESAARHGRRWRGTQWHAVLYRIYIEYSSMYRVYRIVYRI